MTASDLIVASESLNYTLKERDEFQAEIVHRQYIDEQHCLAANIKWHQEQA